MTDYRPEGIQSLVPFFQVEGVPEYIDFVRNAFGVEVITETKNDEGVTFYGTLKFDDTTFFVQEASDEAPAVPVSLYLYVPDLDAAYKRAVDAGATSLAEPQEQFHGDSFAMLSDKWGNIWYLAYATVILDDDQIRERRQKEGK